MTLLQRMAAAARSHLPAVAILAALNLWICRPLFSIEYLDQFASIEGAFVSIARYISRHWGDFSWWPLWHCGMPYQDTYVPLLHLVVAGVATLGRFPAAHAYHIVVAITYSMGPVTLYLMASYLGAPRAAAFLSAVFYSITSPSAFLIPAIAHDIGGVLYSRRLQVLAVYGEGPHISAMTLQPLAIIALAYALRRRSGRSLAWAALALSAIFLTNVPGTMATGILVFSWLAAQPSGSRLQAWKIAGCAAIFGYALACYGIPPSAERTVLGNVGAMHQGFSSAMKYGSLLLAALLAAAAGLGYLLSRTRLPLLPRFALVFAAVTAALVMTANPKRFELLPQAGRLHLEMEMAICLLLGSGLWYLLSLAPASRRPILYLPLVVAAAYQIQNYLDRAHKDLVPADLARHSEYADARWADANLAGQRVYAEGSVSFWWNAFTDVPQVLGCCDQGESLKVLQGMPYLVDPPTGAYHEILTKAYLEALGAQAIVVSGPQSTDEYKPVQLPERFDSMLPALHRELGDTIYAVPQRDRSLAHIVKPSEVVPPTATIYEVYAYSQAIEDTGRPSADFQWLRGDTARVRTTLHRGELVSVQIPWFSGWKAWAGGKRVPITADGIGLQVLHPDCEGACEIEMRWTGRADAIPSAIVSLAALGLWGFLVWRRGGGTKPAQSILACTASGSGPAISRSFSNRLSYSEA